MTYGLERRDEEIVTPLDSAPYKSRRNDLTSYLSENTETIQHDSVRCIKGSASANARKRAFRRLGPKSPLGKARRFIHHLKRYHRLHPTLAAVLYLRVSSRPQDSRKNLDTYEWVLREVCRRRGIPVVAVYGDVCSGWVLDETRFRLIAAVRRARQHQAETGVHTVVLAPCTDRFLRNRLYNCKTAPDITPAKAEFSELKKLSGKVPLVTYLRPDMPLREVTSHRTKWGQQFKNRKGGGDRKPGWRKRRKAKLQPEVLLLRRKGWSYHGIAERLKISSATALKWANEPA